MKKNPGRKERRRIARANRRALGRERSRLNEIRQKDPKWYIAITGEKEGQA